MSRFFIIEFEANLASNKTMYIGRGWGKLVSMYVDRNY